MARTLTTATKNQFTASTLNPIILSEFVFDSATLRFWTGYGDLLWDSVTWTGAGNLIKFETVEETLLLEAKGVAISLNGVPSEIISLAVSEDYQGRVARIYLGAMDSNNTVVVDPVLLFKGYMDTMQFRDSPTTATIMLTVENRLIALERPNKVLWTSESQNHFVPGDKGFDFVPELVDKEIIWGSG